MWDVEQIREAARGRWPEIHNRLGLASEFQRRKHGPCPFCGGCDRYRYDNRQGTGSFFCNGCGAGDGFTMAAKLLGLDSRTDFLKVVEAVAGLLGITSSTVPAPVLPKQHHSEPPKVDSQARERLNTIWNNSIPLLRPEAEPVKKYFLNRGLDPILFDLPGGDVLRFQPELPYWHGGQEIGRFPALVGLVQAPNDIAVTLHRTYLSATGDKAPVPTAKKLMPPIFEGASRGAAIRLYQNGTQLGVTEGLETGLAVRIATGLPVWSTVSAGGMANLIVPKNIKKVLIFADLDKSRAGHNAADRLAARLLRQGVDARIIFPPGPIPAGSKGVDWLDILQQEDHAA
ncbi:MAG: toprim domain-containing protein [Magnetococcales bacterium]|nr:toprim domain-containing protein [Magnetococcales bacterium]